ncbi:MAG: sigma-70 family RNA polymerase sigma factor [Planctomycetaceae bacterium]|nr:sigma-70 family RNA polymerase sigma factor [Planctomycetaceae bacterium]
METSASLLERLCSSPDELDWKRLIEVYTPLVRSWIRRYSSSQRDADDVVQETLTVVIRKLPQFERQRTGSFRAWLRSITVNCLRDSWRASRFQARAPGGSDFHQVLEQMSDPESELSQLWDREHDDHVLRTLLDQIRPSLNEETWQAFYRITVLNESPTDVARELNITVNAVYIAKSRVMGRLRTEARGLIE